MPRKNRGRKKKLGRPKGVKFMGIRYKSRNDLKKKLGGITHKKLTAELRNKTRVIYNTKTHDIAKYNITDKPLIFRKFGIKRVNKRTLLLRNLHNQDVEVFNDIDPDDGDVRVRLLVHVKVYWNDYVIQRIVKGYITTSTDHIKEHAHILATRYASEVNAEAKYTIELIEVQSRLTKQMFRFKDMKLSGVRYDIGCESIDVDEGECVPTYLNNIYPSLQSSISKLPQKGVSVNEITKFCKLHNIKSIAYDINHNIISTNMPFKRCQYKALIYVAYSNHIYPLKNKYLNITKPKYNEIEYVDDINKSILKQLNKKILPRHIVLYRNEICSYVHDGIKYIANSEHEQCLKILTKFGLDDKIYDSIKLNGLGTIIANMFIGESIDSFFPQLDKFSKGGFSYKNNNIITNKKLAKMVKCIDKNKGHGYCLYKLPFLIKVDIRTSQVFKHPTEIIEHYLYVAQPNQSTILMPNTNVYPGYHLLNCKKEGLEFELLECITTTKVKNYFKLFISELYKKVSEKNFKNIVNIMIGKMHKNMDTYIGTIYDRICNKDESTRITGFKINLDDDHVLVTKEKQYATLFTRKPIAFQVLDYMRFTTYNKMKSMNITNDEIVEVHTDSIAYINHELPSDLDPTDLCGWKEEHWEAIPSKITTIYDHDDINFKPTHIYNNTIYNDYAGCGKTTYIKQLVEQYEDYVILTPTHKSRLCYLDKHYNAKVFQSYTETFTIPEEQTIIVDEHGMFDYRGTNLLIKCMLLGKRVISMGDYNQMLPCECTFSLNSKLYMHTFFRFKKTLGTNYRNNFTQKYYNELINEKLDPVAEIQKHSTSTYKDAQYVICYYNNTVDIYNALILKHLKLRWNSNGVRLICKSNKLITKNIYNNMILTITSKKRIKKGRGKPKTIYTLSNDAEITESQLKHHFKPAYALTIYGIQGDDIDSYYFPIDSKKDVKMINGRFAYTLISRLKEDIIVEDDDDNIFKVCF